MNSIAYIVYLVLTYVITVHVGLRFYRNGRIYILMLMKGDESFTDSVNRLLLTGYYLLNLGYAALMIVTWPAIDSLQQALAVVVISTGRILVTLGVIHFFNMTIIFFLSKKHNKIPHQ